MERDTSHLRHREHQEQIQSQQTTQAAVEFASPEEMIRYDATRTEVPASIAQRLNEALLREPKPVRSWWQRLSFWK